MSNVCAVSTSVLDKFAKQKVDGSNVSVIGITLSKGNVIKVTGAKVDRISYKTITNGDGQGIKVYENAAVTSGDHNTVIGATQRGILVDGVCKEVSYNKISDVNWDSIGVYHGGNGGDIHHNTVKNIPGFGIVVQGESQVQKIYNNTVTRCGSYGLGVLQNTIKVIIDNNKFSGKKSKVSIYRENWLNQRPS